MAPQRRDLLKESRHNTVSSNHEILDQFRGMIPHLFCDVHHLLVLALPEGLHSYQCSTPREGTLSLQRLCDIVL